jgi:hypothetical protein
MHLRGTDAVAFEWNRFSCKRPMKLDVPVNPVNTGWED